MSTLRRSISLYLGIMVKQLPAVFWQDCSQLFWKYVGSFCVVCWVVFEWWSPMISDQYEDALTPWTDALPYSHFLSKSITASWCSFCVSDIAKSRACVRETAAEANGSTVCSSVLYCICISLMKSEMFHGTDRAPGTFDDSINIWSVFLFPPVYCLCAVWNSEAFCKAIVHWQFWWIMLCFGSCAQGFPITWRSSIAARVESFANGVFHPSIVMIPKF